MTLSDLELDLYRRLGYAAAPDSTVTTRLRAFLNETQAEILSEPGMGGLLHGSLTFASVASTPAYALPQAVARVHALYETTNDRRLVPQSFDWYRTVYPDVTATTGTPWAFADLGTIGVASQPSNASQLLVDSTAAGDTGTAYIEGFRTGGYVRVTSVTMTGVTAVNLGPSDLLFVTKFYVSAAAVGTITLVEDAEGGTELARIPIGQTYARYRQVALIPTPSAAVTYTVDFEWDPQNMANANDEPLLPPRFHRLLAIGARMKEYEKLEDTARYVAARDELERGKRKLKFFLYSQHVGTPNLQGAGAIRASRLGPWYPAGT